MLAAAEAAADRVEEGEMDVEALSSHATADIIFRTLFSLPNDKDLAPETYGAFGAFLASAADRHWRRTDPLVACPPQETGARGRRATARFDRAIGRAATMGA